MWTVVNSSDCTICGYNLHSVVQKIKNLSQKTNSVSNFLKKWCNDISVYELLPPSMNCWFTWLCSVVHRLFFQWYIYMGLLQHKAVKVLTVTYQMSGWHYWCFSTLQTIKSQSKQWIISHGVCNLFNIPPPPKKRPNKEPGIQGL